MPISTHSISVKTLDAISLCNSFIALFSVAQPALTTGFPFKFFNIHDQLAQSCRVLLKCCHRPRLRCRCLISCMVLLQAETRVPQGAVAGFCRQTLNRVKGRWQPNTLLIKWERAEMVMPKTPGINIVLNAG